MPANNEKPKLMIFDREAGELFEETVAARGLMDFCYGTWVGRLLLRLLLTRRWVSRLFGWFQASRLSRSRIRPFVREQGIDTSEFARPLEAFRSFNDFFIRRLKENARPVAGGTEVLVSPADCRMSVFPISEGSVFPVKGCAWTLEELCGGAIDCRPFQGGLCLVFRLAPPDYHRFGYPVDGMQQPVIQLGGRLHSVNPLALAHGFPVYRHNRRDLCLINSRAFGPVAMIEVGALLVGSIVQHKSEGGPCRRGEEKGYFAFGGSTIIMLLEPGRVTIDQDLLTRSREGVETLLRYGEGIGRAR